MTPPRAHRNAHAAPRGEPYGPERSKVLSAEGFAAAVKEVSSWPDYAPTPLALRHNGHFIQGEPKTRSSIFVGPTRRDFHAQRAIGFG